MKAYLYDVFHNCESITDWTPNLCSLALSSTQKVEGGHSIKMTNDDGFTSKMKYNRDVDWSEYGDIVFWVYHPGWTNEFGLIGLFTNAVNYKRWEFDFAAVWTEITIDLSSAPFDSMGTLDLANISYISAEQLQAAPSEDYYFDFFHSRTIDVTSEITALTIERGVGVIPTATAKVKEDLLLTDDIFFVVRDMFTTANLSRLYKGTYNFGSELGETGTDIGFVDAATLYDGACEIISEWQGHRNVLRLQDDATGGEDPYIVHIEPQATSGTREFWIGTNDVTKYWQFILYEIGVDYIVRLRMYDSALDYCDNGLVWQEIQAIANDTPYHIKIVWRADNTFDLYLNGTLKVDNQATHKDQVSGIDRFILQGLGDSEDYVYLDAYGDPDNDPYYTVGDNLSVEEGDPDQIIFEGYTEGYTERRAQVVNIKSPAKELMIHKPSGDYSGRTDEIIVDLITAYCSYVTAGTLSEGTAMGTITFGGDKSIFQIINEFALTDKFIWYLTPTGVFYYNNGTVDSLVDFTAASEIHGVHSKKEVRPINYVKIKGAYVVEEDVQVESDVYENEEHWTKFGKNPYEITFSHLNTAALCNTTAGNILSRWGSAIRKVQFNHIADEIGLIQEGETITLEYAKGDPTITSDQFVIISSVYEAKRGQATYLVSDAIV